MSQRSPVCPWLVVAKTCSVGAAPDLCGADSPKGKIMRKPRFSWSWRGRTAHCGAYQQIRNELRVRSACEGNTVLVQPRGVANKTTECDLQTALDNAVESQPGLVVLDVSGLLISDERCRETLERVHAKATRRGVTLVAPGASHLLARQLSMLASVIHAGRGASHSRRRQATRSVPAARCRVEGVRHLCQSGRRHANRVPRQLQTISNHSANTSKIANSCSRGCVYPCRRRAVSSGRPALAPLRISTAVPFRPPADARYRQVSPVNGLSVALVLGDVPPHDG